MKNTIIFAVMLFGTIVFSSCTNEKPIDNSTDFTKEYEFTKGIEGPAVDSKGNLYAVNFKEEGTIGIVNRKGESSLFVKLPRGSIGNGIRFDKSDNMYIADYTNHNILYIKNGSKEVAVFAHDSTMNQPNDIAISSNRTLYASDPNWKNGTGNLWMTSNRKLVLVEKNMGTTNGIEVSPDGKKLYVNESIQRNIWVYDITDNGKPINKRIFKTFKDFGLDGMRCDAKGNLYVCRYDKGTIVVLSPEGKELREVQLKGKKPTNIAFGGKDNTQCFVTMADRGCFETFFSQK
ncbi:SMP-30/gluconolactonase/LRE family protein [Aquimarina sp. AU58]|uniref:SMP-30/gluconolactonase/LRE family protein n=1 Tax=Aquimarina sp. AU58 TaxID=1874112 RepID=UPI001F425C43|nr:SMP-30/gluconolactonase/LRE family protein [Aquimarina sp. AU58]